MVCNFQQEFETNVDLSLATGTTVPYISPKSLARQIVTELGIPVQQETPRLARDVGRRAVQQAHMVHGDRACLAGTHDGTREIDAARRRVDAADKIAVGMVVVDRTGTGLM